MITVRMVSSEHCSNPARRRLKNATSTERRLKNATVMHDISESLQSEFEQCLLLLSTYMPGQEETKTKTILHLPAPCNQPEEAARKRFVSYVAGKLSPARKLGFEIHCLLCEQCRCTLEILQQLTHSPIGEEEKTSTTFGVEEARIARACWDRKGKPSSNQVTSQPAAAR